MPRRAYAALAAGETATNNQPFWAHNERDCMEAKYRVPEDDKCAVVYTSKESGLPLILCRTSNSQDAEVIMSACNAHGQLVVALVAAKLRLEFANKHIDCADVLALIESALTVEGGG